MRLSRHPPGSGWYPARVGGVDETGLRVAVTGAAGSLGRQVVARLCAAPEVAGVVALDRAPLPFSHAKLHAVRCDVRDPDLTHHLVDCDALVHLAFIVERGSRDAAETESINLGGTHNVCGGAAAAGVGQIVHASSVAAYGFHPDTDGVMLDEQAPIRGNPEFYYGRHKAELERWLDGFERAHPEIRVVRMRPSIFLGEASARSIGPLRHRLHFRFSGPQPRVQITHEEDVAEAFVLAVLQRARGAYNLACEEPLSLREMGAAMGKRCITIPRGVRRLYRLAWRLKLVDVDPIWLEIGSGHSLLASGEKARRELGWKLQHPTTGDVLRRLSGRPNVRASHAARAFFRPLVRMTRLFGALPAGREARAESRGMQGSVNLVLEGERPSQWHFALRDGRLGVHEGLAPDARATLSLRDGTFTDLLAGRLDPTTAQMTGRIRLRGDGEFAFLLGGLVEQFKRMREARGLRGWPRRRFARYVLREAEPAARSPA
jgi:UDP-glucose 4-epimerase